MSDPRAPPNNGWLEFPIQDVVVVQAGGVGVLAAVAPASGFANALRAIVGNLSVSLCSGSAFQSIAQQIEQTADILASGTDDPGSTCDSISMGMTFTASSQFSGPLPVVNSPCASDAGSD